MTDSRNMLVAKLNNAQVTREHNSHPSQFRADRQGQAVGFSEASSRKAIPTSISIMRTSFQRLKALVNKNSEEFNTCPAILYPPYATCEHFKNALK